MMVYKRRSYRLAIRGKVPKSSRVKKIVTTAKKIPSKIKQLILRSKLKTFEKGKYVPGVEERTEKSAIQPINLGVFNLSTKKKKAKSNKA